MELNIVSNEKSNLVEPNFIKNRFDLNNEKNFLLLEYKTDNKTYYIPAIKQHKTISLGIYLMPLEKQEYNVLIPEIFKKFKHINRIKVEGAMNNYELNSKLSTETNYVTILPENEEIYLQNLSSEWRYNIKRKLKKLHKDFENVEIVKYSDENIPEEVFNQYFQYKKITHNKEYSMSAKNYQTQYHVTDAYILKLNNKTEAIVFNSDIDNEVYLENVTYNTDFSKYSIGITLLYEMINDCIRNKKKAIYWGTNKDYKKHFATFSASTYFGYIYKNKSGLLLKNFFNYFKKH